jgi:hypothetical protein
MAAADRAPLAERLDRLTAKAFAKLEEIINAPNGPGHADHAAFARIQADAAETILVVQMRADESALRDRQETECVRQLLAAVVARKAAVDPPDDG